ncbi:hypothetical protein GCM10009526_31180 [Glutamicibacter creatinolyticus]
MRGNAGRANPPTKTLDRNNVAHHTPVISLRGAMPGCGDRPEFTKPGPWRTVKKIAREGAQKPVKGGNQMVSALERWSG